MWALRERGKSYLFIRVYSGKEPADNSFLKEAYEPAKP